MESSCWFNPQHGQKVSVVESGLEYLHCILDARLSFDGETVSRRQTNVAQSWGKSPRAVRKGAEVYVHLGGKAKSCIGSVVSSVNRDFIRRCRQSLRRLKSPCFWDAGGVWSAHDADETRSRGMSRSSTTQQVDVKCGVAYVCTGMQVCVKRESSMKPLEASQCCGPIDELLDADLFKALGEPTRLKLLSCLAKCGRPCSVTELAECCAVDFSVVSRHLNVLEKVGVLTATKEGRTVFYAVKYRHLSNAFHAIASEIESYRPKRRSAKT
ncbi:ArsR/SmtB family transcription factor [Aporhodopirellula aestuarii]|uniref:ArsR/SmtB family transcription factor n=1 Tax=Aporhodopirellula aestuarii TaxID=2950107 RepID=UPI0038991DE6